LALQRALQQLIANPAISSRIVWQARGSGARNLVVKNTKNESDRARNRRVEVVLSPRISATYPVLVRLPGIGYTWTVRGSAPAVSAAREAESPLTFPDPAPISDSLRVPYKWICSLIVDFGPEPGPVVTGNRVIVRGTGTLISRRHVLTAGHVLLSQGQLRKDIFGSPLDSTLAALSVTAIPGRDGGRVPAVEPLGRHSAAHTRVSPTWKDSYATNRAFDYGLITLDEPLPASYGFWSSGKSQILPPSDSGLKDKVAHCSGYPGSFCPPPDPAVTVPCDDTNRGTVQFQMSGNVTSVSPELIETQMKIAGGHSGSPTWLLGPNDSMNLVGIATASRMQAPEIAVRIRSALLDKIRAWMREDGVRPTF
jgi:V8-like Glu-specific endopeptidase